MRALLRAIASVLRSWLSSLRGAPTPPQPKGLVHGDPDGATSYENRPDVALTAAQPNTDAPTTGNFTEPTEEATDEGDVGGDDASEESGAIPGQGQGASGGAERTHQGQEAVLSSVAESCGATEQAAEKQEPDDEVEPAPRAEHVAETVGEDLDDHTSNLTQPAEEAIDEGDDVGAGDASEESGVGPGRGQGVSDGGQRTRQGQEAALGSVADSYEETDQAGDQEPDDEVEARPRAERVTETVGEDLDDHTSNLTELTEEAIDEGDDVGGDDASEQSGVVPGQGQGVSDGDERTLGQESALDSVAESCRATEQAAEKQEPDDKVEVVSPAKPTAETVKLDLDDQIGVPARKDEGISAADGGRIGGADAIQSSGKPPSGGTEGSPGATGGKERGRRLQYRGPAARPPPPQRLQPQARPPRVVGPRAQLGHATIQVRLIFERGGYCSVSLLPQRLRGLPEQLVVSNQGGDVELVALEDQWYQDVVPANLGDLLRNGIVWKDSDTGRKWLLRGREVFVLAHGSSHRGFVSCPKLSLGRSHLVLCTATILGPVEDALRAAGCDHWSQLGEDDGAPSGWRVLREVVPQKAVPLSANDDILNILRPLPEIEIALEGGIRLAYNTWLLGYPPAILLYGDRERNEKVLIDGLEASASEDDGYTAPGWDIQGHHQVFCSNINRRYSLVRSQENWSYWPANSCALDSSQGDERRFEFCGPLVRPVAIDGRTYQRRVVSVPATNPVLLGAGSGEIFFARSRPDVRAAQCLGLPPFDPVWALPHEPLRCDKRTNRILLVGDPAAGDINASREPAGSDRDIKGWCSLILDANRKGLSVEPSSPATDHLWLQYKRVARRIWRRLR